MNWLNDLLTNQDGVLEWWAVLIAVLIVLAVAAIVVTVIVLIMNSVRKKSEKTGLTKQGWTARQLVFGALCIAVAFALSFLKFFEMPFGGSITPASMLPIMMFAYIYGTPKGLIVGLGYGMLQMLQGIFVTPLESPVLQIIQILMDYGVAFMALALAGLFKKNLLLGVLAGGLGRLAVSTISGMLFFAMYAEGQSVFAYSFVYNLTYIGPDIVICFVVALIPGIRKAIDSFKAQRPKEIAA